MEQVKLELCSLTKQFANKLAVDKVDALLEPGVIGLLGANGAGKTTLMRMICDVLRPSSGEILFNGVSTQQLGEQYRALLGYLPQDFGYYPNFSALDFLLYMGACKGLTAKEAKQTAHDLLGSVGLLEVAKKKIKTFSGGMKQRLGIAQAIINDPKILVLDEPTAGLDPKERVRFRNLIASIAEQKIVLLSTHIVSDIEYIANRILVMQKGRFIMDGRAEELVERARGSVWELHVSRTQAQQLSATSIVANVHYNTDGSAVVRIIEDSAPALNATPAEPTLEDLYLYIFRGEATQNYLDSRSY